MERPRAGLDLQSPPADADLPGKPGGQGLSLQRLFRPEPNPQDRRRELQAQSVGAGRPQDALDAARALPAAAGIAGNAARLRRRLEHDRQMDRGPIPDFPAAHWRGLDGEICRLRVRRRILLQHRYGVGAAPADLSHLQDFRRDPGAALRLSAQAAHSDQARVQESEMDYGDIRDQPLPRRLVAGLRLQLVFWGLTVQTSAPQALRKTETDALTA